MNFGTSIISQVHSIKQLFSNDENWPIAELDELSERVAENFQKRKKVAFVGNGGSAAEAMHLAAEFTGKCVKSHNPWPALCLNESQSSLTAIANDFGHEYMFSRQVEAHLDSGDILIALSTSGKSKNILNALHLAIDREVKCYLWSGSEAPVINGVKTWRVSSTVTPRIQEIHLAWGHLLAEQVEYLLC